MNHLSERIALFMPGLAGGGAERVMLNLARSFVDAGYSMDLVVTKAAGPLVCELSEAVRLVDLGAPRIIASLPALIRYFRRERPQAMLSAMAPANCLAVWARSIARVPSRLVISEHSTPSLASKGADNWRGRLLPQIMRLAYSKADTVVAVSDGVADDLASTIRLPRERIEVIYNPVVTPAMLELSQEPLEHPWFGYGQPPVILGVGRLIPLKDFPTLIRGFAQVRQQHEARLIILGEGAERPRLEALVAKLGVEEDVDLPGFVRNPYAYMRHAAIFVLCSRREGLPTVLIEAMACDTPVVATDCPSGPWEILDGGKWGKLVPVGQELMLAEAMKEFLVLPGPKAHQRAMYFSAKHATKQYVHALKLTGRSAMASRSTTPLRA